MKSYIIPVNTKKACRVKRTVAVLNNNNNNNIY